MKALDINLSATSFCAAVNTVSKAQGKTTLPILDNILLKINPEMDKIILKASNIEISSQCDCECVHNSHQGEVQNLNFTIGKTALEMIKTLPEQPINLQFQDDTLEVKYGTGKASFSTMNADEFPESPRSESNIPHIAIIADKVLTLLQNVSVAVEDDTLRPVLSGVLFDINKKEFIMVSSDGNILIKDSYTGDEMSNLEKEFSFILPKQGISPLKAFLLKKEKIVISYDNNNIFFQTENKNDILTVKCIEGRFPNYNAVIPTSFIANSVFDSAIIKNVVKRITLCKTGKTKLIVVQNTDNNHLNLSVEDIDYSMTAAEEVEALTEGTIRIGLDGNKLSEILNVVSGNVKISFSSPTSAMAITQMDEPEDEHIIFIIMPMLLND